jgi:hypothetical protein
VTAVAMTAVSSARAGWCKARFRRARRPRPALAVHGVLVASVRRERRRDRLAGPTPGLGLHVQRGDRDAANPVLEERQRLPDRRLPRRGRRAGFRAKQLRRERAVFVSRSPRAGSSRARGGADPRDGVPSSAHE